ncbi:MAG: M24 family metallopeptidase [Patescibacteria group bacterium]|nr:M24 family metallopeptidase [Patescibacteria group bacterium]
MPWSRRQFVQHLAAARLLDHIRQETWQYIRMHQRCSEYEVQRFILSQFRRYRLRSSPSQPIVAFRKNTAQVHYFPPRSGSLRLRPQTLVLLDIWARLPERGSPYADLTWMAWHGGRVPATVAGVFHTVRRTRDACLRYVRHALIAGRLPVGREIDAYARTMIARAGFRGRFLHSLGHSLGVDGPHGSGGNLSPKNSRPLALGMGYTIEPGIYLTRQFGVRLEMDYYITPHREAVVTAELQHEIERV